VREEEVVDGEARLRFILIVGVGNDLPIVFQVLRVVDKGDSAFRHDKLVILKDVIDEAD